LILGGKKKRIFWPFVSNIAVLLFGPVFHAVYPEKNSSSKKNADRKKR
jgi:hypothetical protein